MYHADLNVKLIVLIVPQIKIGTAINVGASIKA